MKVRLLLSLPFVVSPRPVYIKSVTILPIYWTHDVG